LSKNNIKYTTALRIIIAALAVSMLVAGPNMALLQQHQVHAAPQIKKQEQSTIEGLHGNDFAKRSAAGQQHTDRENQCLRIGKYSNADLGQQTLGNDNSVTGFTDQSKNVQSRVVITPTPKVTPTPTPTITPTPIGTPMTGTLGITKLCSQPCPDHFSITVTGNNPQPSSFTLGNRDTRSVSLGPGAFTVTETPVAGFFAPHFTVD
jgi:hypothetical protein